MINQVDDLLELALSKLPAGDISGALNVLEEAGEIQPNHTGLINLMADCYYLLGDFYQAKQNWTKVLALDKGDKTAQSKLKKFNSPVFQFWLKRYYQAIESIENKDFLTAQNNLKDLIKENDNFISLYQLLGLTHLALNDERNAVRVWKQGLKLDKNNPELTRYINAPKRGIRKPRLSRTKAEKTTSGSKNNLLLIVSGMFVMLLLLQMSFSLNSDRDYKNTIQSLQAKIVDLNEELKKSEPVVAVLNKTDKLNEEPIPLTNEGSNYDVEDEKEYYKKGYQAYLVQDYKTAINNLSVVVAISSGSYINREGLYYLALSHFCSKNYPEAKHYYLVYLEQFPNTNYTDESLYYLACVYYHQGDLENARLMLRQLEEFDPQSCYILTPISQKIMTQSL